MQDAMNKIGLWGRDIITGFEGRITGACRYITGCDQLCLTPRMKADGTTVDGRWFDENRVEIDPETTTLIITDRGGAGALKGAPSGGGEQAPAYR